MKKLTATIDDDRNHCWTYELPDGRRIAIDRDHVRKHGAAFIIRQAGLEPFAEGEENALLPVYQCGELIGTLPATFDPETAKSGTFLFSVRPGDFIREGNRWIACQTLGPGDLDSLTDFARLRGRRSPPASATPEEEALGARSPSAGVEAYLGRMLGGPDAL